MQRTPQDPGSHLRLLPRTPDVLDYLLDPALVVPLHVGWHAPPRVPFGRRVGLGHAVLDVLLLLAVVLDRLAHHTPEAGRDGEHVRDGAAAVLGRER